VLLHRNVLLSDGRSRRPNKCDGSVRVGPGQFLGSVRAGGGRAGPGGQGSVWPGPAAGLHSLHRVGSAASSPRDRGAPPPGARPCTPDQPG